MAKNRYRLYEAGPKDIDNLVTINHDALISTVYKDTPDLCTHSGQRYRDHLLECFRDDAFRVLVAFPQTAKPQTAKRQTIKSQTDLHQNLTNDEAVGFIAFWEADPKTGVAFIEDLYARQQRRGIGAALFDATRTILKKQKTRMIDVQSASLEETQSFYHHIGFRRYGSGHESYMRYIIE